MHTNGSASGCIAIWQYEQYEKIISWYLIWIEKVSCYFKHINGFTTGCIAIWQYEQYEKIFSWYLMHTNGSVKGCIAIWQYEQYEKIFSWYLIWIEKVSCYFIHMNGLTTGCIAIWQNELTIWQTVILIADRPNSSNNSIADAPSLFYLNLI